MVFSIGSIAYVNLDTLVNRNIETDIFIDYVDDDNQI